MPNPNVGTNAAYPTAIGSAAKKEVTTGERLIKTISAFPMINGVRFVFLVCEINAFKKKLSKKQIIYAVVIIFSVVGLKSFTRLFAEVAFKSN